MAAANSCRILGPLRRRLTRQPKPKSGRIPLWGERMESVDRKARQGGKTLVIGLGKTGTSTLGVMLKTLGYDVCGPNKPILRAVRAGDLSAFDPALDAHDAFEDWPWPLAYRHAVERFGKSAKFILTVRASAENRRRSLEDHAYGVDPLRSMRLAIGRYRPFGHEAEMIRIYEDHNREVRAFFADRADQLLEFCLEAGDGWDKLCLFLGRPRPDVPVPHANPTQRSRKRLNRFLNGVIRPIYERIT